MNAYRDLGGLAPSAPPSKKKPRLLVAAAQAFVCCMIAINFNAVLHEGWLPRWALEVAGVCSVVGWVAFYVLLPALATWQMLYWTGPAPVPEIEPPRSSPGYRVGTVRVAEGDRENVEPVEIEPEARGTAHAG